MIDDELTPSALSAEAQADLEALVDGGRFATTGPLAIVSTAQDLRPEEQRPPVRAVSLEATMTVTEYAA